MSNRNFVSAIMPRRGPRWMESGCRRLLKDETRIEIISTRQIGLDLVCFFQTYLPITVVCSRHQKFGDDRITQ